MIRIRHVEGAMDFSIQVLQIYIRLECPDAHLIQVNGRRTGRAGDNP